MNKYLYTIIRIFEWLYIAAYAAYFIFVGYELLFTRQAPASTIPVLSTTLLQSDTKALEGRIVLPAGALYTASVSATFGKSEPFN